MKIHFFGAAQTVTGSQHLIEVNGVQVLLDCGLFQGRREESYRRNHSFPFNPRELRAVILSHAHIDHSGNLPNLVRRGFRGLIYATSATAHLTNLMLLDSGHIQEADAAFYNRKIRKKGEPEVEPLYNQEDAAHVAQYFQPVDYGQVFQAAPGVRASFFDAGHILGSAGVLLELEENGRRKRVWFSGDIGRRDLPLLRDPVLPEPVDLLVMECTYGDKLHEDPQAAYDELHQVVSQTIERRGKVIIPAFAVGRTQELVYNLNKMIRAGELPPLPVYVDSPLAVKATDIFRAHPECFDQETKDFAASGHFETALEFEGLVYTRSVEQSKSLNTRKDPMIIISASGMAEAGRILHHLRNNIGDSRNTILIVSWQAPYTLGRRLADREEKVRIFGEEYTRRALVATIGGFSAHAGQRMLVEYARAASRNGGSRTYLVHGEERAARTLTEKLAQAGIADVFHPVLGQVVEI
jgi:metallo-beta-lactamase family protein